jgi:Zn-dependent alcohol dehydrogenase
VRVKLQASGVNPADAGRRAGSYRAMEYPRVIPNSDGAGIVDQLGEGVTRLSIGQRVWLYNGQRNGRAFGTAAETITLAEHLVTPLSADVSFATGATLGIPGMTAWCCLFGDGPIAGQTVLVTGGAGAVGHYAVQLAKWGGARVIATVSSSLKAEQARLAGADLVINYKTEDVVAKAMAARRRPRGGCRFRRQYRDHAQTDGDEFDYRGVRHQRQPQSSDPDARADGKMHRAALAGAVRAAAAVVIRRTGRHFQMARRGTSASQHRRAVRAVGNRASASCR